MQKKKTTPKRTDHFHSVRSEGQAVQVSGPACIKVGRTTGSGAKSADDATSAAVSPGVGLTYTGR